jgi:O-acetyl-ADP-ribose deacetylase (regulator of RNase III)
MTSIAFPTLGCGFLSHPPDIVANIMKRCIAQFEETFPDTTLKQVFFVVFTKARDWEHVTKVSYRKRCYNIIKYNSKSYR